MIDEKKLIENIVDAMGNCNLIQADTLKQVICFINRQPKIGEWIPCSDRLPELNKDVLICFPDGDIHIASRTCEELFDFIDHECNIFKNVIAWQPLPEPYKEKIS